MKYTALIEIALPREKVLDLLSDPTRLPKWLRGVVVHEPLNAEHGRYGTRSRVVMQMDQQRIEATEVVTRREPENLEGIPAGSVVYYERELEALGMWSVARERLIEVNRTTTLWESENEYRFGSILMRMASVFMRGAFRRQSEVHMRDFKAFAEHGIDVRDANG